MGSVDRDLGDTCGGEEILIADRRDHDNVWWRSVRPPTPRCTRFVSAHTDIGAWWAASAPGISFCGGKMIRRLESGVLWVMIS